MNAFQKKCPQRRAASSTCIPQKNGPAQPEFAGQTAGPAGWWCFPTCTIPSLAHIIVSLWIRCGSTGLLLPAHPGGPCGSRTAHLRSGFPLSGGVQPAGGGRAGKIQLRAHRAGQTEPAAEVVQLVGGTENISSVAHCMIRLRFAVKDLNKADQEALKKIPGVLSVTPAA